MGSCAQSRAPSRRAQLADLVARRLDAVSVGSLDAVTRGESRARNATLTVTTAWVRSTDMRRCE